jgi:hypothetical protein
MVTHKTIGFNMSMNGSLYECLEHVFRVPIQTASANPRDDLVGRCAKNGQFEGIEIVRELVWIVEDSDQPIEAFSPLQDSRIVPPRSWVE